MNNITKILIASTVVLLCFVFYKIGDKNGYQEGFDYGYSLDCREDLRKVGTYAAKTGQAVDSVRKRLDDIRIDMNVPDSLRWETFAEDNRGRKEYYSLTNREKILYKQNYIKEQAEAREFESRANKYMRENNVHEYHEYDSNGVRQRSIHQLGRKRK